MGVFDVVNFIRAEVVNFGLAPRYFTYSTPNRSAADSSKVIVDLALQYPRARTIHLVVDNRNIHRRKSLTDLLGDQIGGEIWGHLTVHYTPVHGKKYPRSKNAAPPGQGLEPPNESGSNPNQRELHAEERPRQVRLQKEVFQAVKALVRGSCLAGDRSAGQTRSRWFALPH
jgi:hypothetical protein